MLLPMSPTDSMFLLGESREHPMHVGGLVLLQPPEGMDATDVRAMLDAALRRGDVAPRLRKRARRSVTSLGQWGWDTDTEIDLDHHVRHDALPQPGGMTELMDLVSRLHAGLLDRNRPLWEMHLIEGLADGRYAVYMKIHHAVADGVSAMRMLRRALSEDPDARDMPAPWEPNAGERRAALTVVRDEPQADRGGALDLAASAVRATRGAVGEAASLVPALVATVDRALHDRGGALSLAAPRTVFNVPIGGARRFAARSWPIERLRLVAKFADATINDVVLAMCSGALRTHLADRVELPDSPLVAMVPVSLRSERREGTAGNEIGMLTCSLGTHLDAPSDRLAAVRESMLEGKESMRTRSATQIRAMSALGVVPLAMGMFLGSGAPIRPANVMISNVPGPGTPLYWNGARLTALYPLSIPVDGQALNITCTSTDDEIAFGLTGCRRTVPDLEPMLGYLDDELGALERVVGL
ncbi:wax ester/triacylglycerol synthase family O-acyltransferase [Rhodococcus spelaei]|uniref:Diacylglycerol O-acyltransferase n=1 Tax=Rhodococcus spelaei TaxID=2546320 RepID=A0A541BNU4_9NOCA|nr:wax ester/triacylglycerol synthase family O-acyltransferase [Rhodococcus spelaei]TQF73989.1 wax ester/triacylglycerol synthase family O-acyltransferase [Rhodococcus spelaei]